MRCSRCGTPHTPEHALIVVGTCLLCKACLHVKDATSFPEHDGWVPPFDLTMPLYHPPCKPRTSFLSDAFEESAKRALAQLVAIEAQEREL